MPHSDTTAEAHAVLVERMRQLTPAECVARALELSEVLRRAAFDMVQREHPAWSRTECKTHLLRVWYGIAYVTVPLRLPTPEL